MAGTGLDPAAKQLKFFAMRSRTKRKREWKMPIRRYVEDGVVFTPKTLSAMSHALQDTTEILERKRQAVAKFIIRLAGEDDSLDATTLRRRAVAALGGVAYCDVPANPQLSLIPGGIAE